MDTKDRELLELAAKAAGHDTSHPMNAERLDLDPPVMSLVVPGVSTAWNPLTDDGDALRLAAALRLQILPGKHYGDGCSVNPTNHPTPGVTSFVESKDMAEQMRRAITWAAAEIGRSM